ncbi:MAG TPA: 2'-5' RNA ligase family protein [Candidatus Nanoarchaeia archaeon]|nr:2'-5' RNA ligase family protein [Candidatus Nanoarchaeia archaeon]
MRYVIAAPIRGSLANKIDSYKELHQQDILELPKLPVHYTILATELFERKEDEVLKRIKAIADTQLELETKCKELDVFDNNALVLKLKKTPNMQLLHDRVCFELRPLLWHGNLEEENKKKEQRIRKYGSAYAGPNYRPHVTLFHPKEDSKKDRDHFRGDSVAIDSIGVWVKNDKWKLLSEFELRRQSH